ncbi:hypothetical protein P3T76_009025 [Phytophthora citrophthora]|uniref:Elicitin n=1 Tax=Phytophthora citrophthora TaxID=4793 RepID=A0AAD9GI17_9STRA|nr:hypothetical protein P3T76_009025 [Phytophthora citrophthora]
MTNSFIRSATVFLLFGCTLSAVTSTECSDTVSNPIKASLDDKTLFSTCAATSSGVRLGTESLLDVLNLPEQAFLLFCRAPTCIKPVETLLSSIPTDCLITYHGSPRNISAEVSTLYSECVKVVGAADKTDEDYVYRYFLD